MLLEVRAVQRGFVGGHAVEVGFDQYALAQVCPSRLASSSIAWDRSAPFRWA